MLANDDSADALAGDPDPRFLPRARRAVRDDDARPISAPRCSRSSGPGTGDDTRAWGPPYDAAGEATYFQSVNRNKRSIALDLVRRGRPRPRPVAGGRGRRPRRELPPGRDGPAAASATTALRSDNAGLIYCSITGFGAGAGAELPGYDLLIQAVGGLMSITGDPGRGAPEGRRGARRRARRAVRHRRDPRRAAPPRTDRPGAARRGRPPLIAARRARQPGLRLHDRRLGCRPGWATPTRASPRTRLYRTGEGELVLAVGNDRQFTALCEILGVELGRHRRPRFATNASGSPTAPRCATSSRMRSPAARRARGPRELIAAARARPASSTTSAAPSSSRRTWGWTRSSSSARGRARPCR